MAPGLAATVVTALVAFAATNVDDVVILAVLFARRDGRFGTRQIVVGQALGFAVLVVASVAAAAGLLALPEAAVGLLGLVPLVLGLRGLWLARRGGAGEDEEAPAAMTTAGVLSITVANGADNVAVYAPLFATLGSGGTAVAVVVFFLGLAALLVVSALVGSRPAVVRAVDWAGDYAVPVVLVVLGVVIVAESGLLGQLWP